jgi:hypothetical protein
LTKEAKIDANTQGTTGEQLSPGKNGPSKNLSIS